MKRTVTLMVVATVLALLLLSSEAAAEFTTPKLLSGTAKLQFERAEAPAMASEGEYVAFQGVIEEVSGVWRRNLQSGAVEPVASAYDSAAPALSAPSFALAARDAAAPSISANGRYVAFTTTANLEPEHLDGSGEPQGEPASDTGCPEVYVRDMDLPASSPGAYTLASAIGGSGAGIVFTEGCAGPGTTFPVAGAQAAPGVALSADGRSVAFTVLSRSNLTRGPSCPASAHLWECPAETPPSQVAVRDLETGTTTLVSETPQGQPAPGGGAYPSERSAAFKLGLGSTSLGDEVTASTAAISGDGSTVVWLGTDVPAQVPSSGPEIETRTKASAGEDPTPYEVEPLWRRIADGEDTVTKRLLSGAGLEFFYSLSEPNVEASRAGSFVATRTQPLFIPPVISADGETIALVADAPRPTALRSLVLSGQYPPQSDAYAIHVSAAPDALPEVRPLTETPDYDLTSSTAAYGFVTDVAISPDGSHVAFDTSRSELTLPSLALISPSAATGIHQTYVANLDLGTLQRATVSYDGSEPVGGPPGLLSFSRTGDVLAFASAATNLFYGDATNGSEVYLTREIPDEEAPAGERVAAAPEELLPSLEWKLNATAVAERDGSVLVRVQTPAAGRLGIQASAEMTARAAQASRRRYAASRHLRTSGNAGPRLLVRTVATASILTALPAKVQLRLRVDKAFRADLEGRGLYAVLHVTFAVAGRKTLSVAIPVTFRRVDQGKARQRQSRSKATRIAHGAGK